MFKLALNMADNVWFTSYDLFFTTSHIYTVGVDVPSFGRLMQTCDIIFLCVCLFIMDLCRHSGPACVVLNDI